MNTTKQIIGLIVWIVLCEGVGFLASRFTTPEISGWYAGLQKPSWNPPNAVFAPVWTTLYALMGLAAWLVWRRWGAAPVLPALIVFLLQLGFNFIWSFIFFSQHNPGLAFLDIVVLWIAIVLTIVLFWPHSRLAAVLLLPYLLWVSFATTLNYALWKLNPQP